MTINSVLLQMVRQHSTRCSDITQLCHTQELGASSGGCAKRAESSMMTINFTLLQMICDAEFFHPVICRSWASLGGCARWRGAARCSCSGACWSCGGSACRPLPSRNACRPSSGGQRHLVPPAVLSQQVVFPAEGLPLVLCPKVAASPATDARPCIDVCGAMTEGRQQRRRNGTQHIADMLGVMHTYAYSCNCKYCR